MRANEFIIEAFDKPYKGKWEKSEYGDVDLNTKLPDGTNLSIMFNNQQDDEGKEIVQVEFYRNNSQEVTGEGDAQRIFATVLNAIQKYIKKYKPQKLSFSANKSVDIDADDNGVKFNPESRAKLYNRLVQRYASDWGYQAQIDDEGDVVIYQLTRAQGVAEEDELEEDWKSKLATGAMAGAMAMGGAHATGPEWTERPDGSIVKSIKQAGNTIKDKLTPTFMKKEITPKAEPGMSLLSRNNPQAEEVLHTTALKAGLRGVELAQFLAQTRHESADFAHMKEIGNKQRFAKYEAPHKARQLGNKYKGDGERFKGRGFIQLTGRDNYTRASEQIFGDDRLVKNPDLASRLDIASHIALWYWKNQVRPKVNNFNNTVQVVRAINANEPMNVIKQRHNKFKEYMAVL